MIWIFTLLITAVFTPHPSSHLQLQPWAVPALSLFCFPAFSAEAAGLWQRPHRCPCKTSGVYWRRGQWQDMKAKTRAQPGLGCQYG